MDLNIYILLLIFLVILMYFQPSFLGDLCTNCFGKAILVLLIVFLAIKDISLAILASVILITSMHLVSREGFKEGQDIMASALDAAKKIANDDKKDDEKDDEKDDDEKTKDKKNKDKKKDDDSHSESESESESETESESESENMSGQKKVKKEKLKKKKLGFRVRKRREGFMTSNPELINFEETKIRPKDSNIYPVSRSSVQNNQLFSGFNLF